MKLQLLRNATQVLTINEKTILIDPMLASRAAYEPFQFTGNNIKNPLVDLPMSKPELELLLHHVDAVLLTHIHLDHWDVVAQQLLRKNIPIICQPGNMSSLEQAGFNKLLPVETALAWHDIQICRTGGQHGTGETGKRMGCVSGYVITHNKETLYVAGDTIWCNEVQETLDRYQPNYIVINGGAARFMTGDPIVMNIPDVLTVCRYAPESKVYVVHLEAVNHSKESRSLIKSAIASSGFTKQCFVPEDGEVYLSV